VVQRLATKRAFASFDQTTACFQVNSNVDSFSVGLPSQSCFLSTPEMDLASYGLTYPHFGCRTHAETLPSGGAARLGLNQFHRCLQCIERMPVYQLSAAS
jgi:hypothetical protein